MKQEIFTVRSQEKIAKDVIKIVLCGNTDAITAPGQFVNIKLDGFYLRRPISVCDYDKKTLTLIYKTVGEGTRALSRCEIGSRLDILVGLGNGYDLSVSGEKPLLIGGGVGVPPLYNLCKRLTDGGKRYRSYSALTVRTTYFTKRSLPLSAQMFSSPPRTAATVKKALSPTPWETSNTAIFTPAVPSRC